MSAQSSKIKAVIWRWISRRHPRFDRHRATEDHLSILSRIIHYRFHARQCGRLDVEHLDRDVVDSGLVAPHIRPLGEERSLRSTMTGAPEGSLPDLSSSAAAGRAQF